MSNDRSEGSGRHCTCWMYKLLKEREVVNEKIAITVDVVMFDHSL